MTPTHAHVGCISGLCTPVGPGIPLDASDFLEMPQLQLASPASLTMLIPNFAGDRGYIKILILNIPQLLEGGTHNTPTFLAFLVYFTHKICNFLDLKYTP